MRRKVLKNLLKVVNVLLILSLVMNMWIGVNAVTNTYSIVDLSGKYKTQGRVSIVGDTLMLDWSASGIEFIADCQGDIEVTFDSSRSKAFFTVIVDGVVQHAEDRIPADGNWVDGDWSVTDYPFYISSTGESTFTIAENLSKGQHHIEIYSQNEWSSGTYGIKSITLNGKFLEPPKNNGLYIETVGDSITTGYGNLGKKGTDYISTVQQDATRGFTYLTARNLNADWSIVGRGGICASTWGGKGVSPAMDTLYLTQRGLSDLSSSYTFSRQPDVILVSLGTNDEANYSSKGATAAECKQGFVDFINILRENNPNSKIVWLYGMINENTGLNDRITGAVAEAGGEDSGIYTLRLPRNIQGGANHPDVDSQTTYADMITAFIKKIVKNYTPSIQSNLVNWSSASPNSAVTSAKPFDAGELPVKGTEKAVYMQYIVTPNESAAGTSAAIAPFVTFADVKYNGSDYVLGLKMTSGNGHELGLYNSNDITSPVYTFWTGEDYSDTESGTIGGPYTITAEIENNTLNLLRDAYDLSVTADDGSSLWNSFNLDDFGITVNKVKVSATYNYSSLGYGLSVNVWTSQKNSHTVYDVNDHYRIQNVTTAKYVSNTTPVMHDEYSVSDLDNRAVYNYIGVKSYITLSGTARMDIYLAETDFNAYGYKWYLGLRLLDGTGGWRLCLLTPDSGQTWRTNKTIYQSMPYEAYTGSNSEYIFITTKIENGKASVWLEDKNIISDYSTADYNITKPVVGTSSSNYAYYVKFSSWILDEEPEYDKSHNVGSVKVTAANNTAPEIYADYEGVVDETGFIYNKINVKKANTWTEWISPYIIVAETDYKVDAEDTNTWYLAVRLTSEHGYKIGLWDGYTIGSSGPSIKEGIGISYYNYPTTGTLIFPDDGVEIITKTGNGKATIWIDGQVANYGVFDYQNANYNIIKSTVGSFIINSAYKYSLTCQSWVESDNYVSVLPTFNEASQIKLVEENDRVLDTGECAHYDETVNKMWTDASAPLYVEYTFNASDDVVNWYSPCLWLAATDYEGPSGNPYYLTLICYGGHGYSIALCDDMYNRTGNIGVSAEPYPDTDSAMITTGRDYKVIVKNQNNAITCWIDGHKIISDYSPDTYNITNAAVGGCMNYYRFTLDTKVWVDNENYALLGDVNGDLDIDIRDLVGMKKLITDYESYKPFNNAVISLSGGGTISFESPAQISSYLMDVDAITQMRDYILAVINSFSGGV